MNDVAAQEKKPWLNSKVLRSAREWRGRTVEEAAKKISKRPEDIIAWETNSGSPTVRQARILAEFYGRAFLEFFLPELPVVSLPALVPDYKRGLHRRLTIGSFRRSSNGPRPSA